MEIRCKHCGKIIASWLTPDCIEIRNGKRCAILQIRRAKIICDRCGSANVIYAGNRIPRLAGIPSNMGAGKPLKEGVRG